jgi:hypothetical protein
MATNLQLEYVCSVAEIDEAKLLCVRKHIGGGSKWKTRFYQIVILIGLLAGAWFRFEEFSPTARLMLLVALVAGSVLFVRLRKKFRKVNTVATRLEISDSDITVLNGDSKVAFPWSAFTDPIESPNLFVLVDRPKQMMIIVPKRVFPDETLQTWFRETARNPSDNPVPAPSQPSAQSTSATSDRMILSFDLNLLDHVACTLASWRTWGFCIAIVAFQFGLFLASSLNPPQDAELGKTLTEVFFCYQLPGYLAFVVIFIVLFSLVRWWSSVKYSAHQELILSQESLTFSNADSSGQLPWSHFAYFKETPWSFILWRGPAWMQIPKRGFGSLNDINRCRDLLDFRLKQSRWFFG